MNKKLKIKIGIDVGMTGCLLFLMPYSLLSETAHEWIGAAMFLLFLGHHFLNRKWILNLTKGNFSPYRIVQTVLAVVMLLCMMGSMVSGIVLSNHIFKFVKIAGISMGARQVHMFCAYWGFVVMSLHLGMHGNMVAGMIEKLFGHPSVIRKWGARCMAGVIGCYGIYAFWKRQIGAYLFMRMHFVFYDYTESVLYFMLDYLSVMILIAMFGYYGSIIVKKRRRGAL